ncbi:MAG: glycosyltransferase family 9 protein [Gemmatimonadaceae bacterium]
MAQSWISTPRKRLMVAGLNALARVARPWLAGQAGVVNDRAHIRRILVVELWNIGDIVLTMPFLTQLRARFPRAEITLLGRPHARTLLEGTELVDQFLETELTWTDASLNFNPFAYDWRELRRVYRQLRHRNFDIAFQCRMHVREHFILALSGAPRRVGYQLGPGKGVLTDALRADDSGRHKAADWLELLTPFGGQIEVEAARLSVPTSERTRAKEYLARQGVLAPDVVIGIHPGASVAEKRWPLDRFREVAESLSKRPGVRIVAFIEPGGYGESLSQVPGMIRAQVGLRELMALIEQCDLLVCNDSGPMHLAGALGVPAVAVFAAGIDRLFAPFGEGHEVVSPEADPAPDCPVRREKHPLYRVRVPDVLAGVERGLQRIRPRL